MHHWGIGVELLQHHLQGIRWAIPANTELAIQIQTVAFEAKPATDVPVTWKGDTEVGP